eukprot:616711-Pyramimonas_sp.AAC.1
MHGRKQEMYRTVAASRQEKIACCLRPARSHRGQIQRGIQQALRAHPVLKEFYDPEFFLFTHWS